MKRHKQKGKKPKIKVVTTLVLITFLAFSCSGKESSSSEGGAVLKTISGADAKEVADEKESLVILDVRTPSEYAEGHIKGAENLDFYGSDFKGSLEELDKETPYLIYCRSGNRSGQALSLMKSLGFREVYNLSGGIGSASGRFSIVK